MPTRDSLLLDGTKVDARVRRSMVEKGFKTLREIAEFTGMHRDTLAAYMRGKRADRSHANLLASRLGCSVTDLLACPPPEPPSRPAVKVIGVGGYGGNAVERMVSEGMEGVEFIAVDTDRKALESLSVETTLQIGAMTTADLAAPDPEKERLAAQEDRVAIQHAVEGADMAFVIAGMGGGTGTEAAPLVAHLARSMDILTVAVVTMPLYSEWCHEAAEAGMVVLRQQVDALIVIPNRKSLHVIGADAGFAGVDEAFVAADDLLRWAVHGIADLVIRPGTVLGMFPDLLAFMSGGGLWTMGTGRAVGDDRARLAMEAAIRSPQLDKFGLRYGSCVVVNVTTAKGHRLSEWHTVCSTVRELAAKDSVILAGWVNDQSVGESMRVTVFARKAEERPLCAINQLGAGQAARQTYRRHWRLV